MKKLLNFDVVGNYRRGKDIDFDGKLILLSPEGRVFGYNEDKDYFLGHNKAVLGLFDGGNLDLLRFSDPQAYDMPVMFLSFDVSNRNPWGLGGDYKGKYGSLGVDRTSSNDIIKEITNKDMDEFFPEISKAYSGFNSKPKLEELANVEKERIEHIVKALKRDNLFENVEMRMKSTGNYILRDEFGN